MSEEAILRRLRTVDCLRELSLSWMKAKKESNEKAKENKLKDAQETTYKYAENLDES